MSAQTASKIYTIKLAHHPHSGNFFVDFCEKEGDTLSIVISLKISEGEAKGLSRSTGILILEQ